MSRKVLVIVSLVILTALSASTALAGPNGTWDFAVRMASR